MDEKQIDLDRRDYRAEPVKGEPIFAAGWPIGLAVGVSILIAAYFSDGTTESKLLGAALGVVATALIYSFAEITRR